LTVERIIETAEASASSNIEINDMLGAEFYVQTAEREAKRRADLLKKNNRAR
jgi:exosome complex component RRP4